MIAGLILICSLAALLQFFVSYCRSLITASSREPLSIQARDVTGIVGMTAPAGEFQRFMQLLQLCPERPEDRGPVRAVRIYYRLLHVLCATVSSLAPRVASWAESERARCAYFAAVILDRRIAFSRSMLAQQLGE
jgi:hypothetical protein